MSNGYHFVYLPILFSLVIPLALLFYALTVDSQIDFDFYYYFLIAIAVILILINIIDSTLVFIYRKGNTKKFNNALRGKDLLKWFVYTSVVILAVSIITQILIKGYPDIVPEDQKSTINSGNIAIVVFFSLYMFLFSISAILPVLLRSDYFRGRSFAHFQIGFDEKNQTKKIWSYQNGLFAYEKFLNEKFGMKFKHFDEIESYLISEQSQQLEDKIKDLLNTFGEELAPSRKLNSLIKITSENILKNQKPYEHIERILKYLYPVIPAAAAIALYFVELS